MANEYIVINDDLRTMQIPSSISILGVESDDDVNKIPFQMPKEYCGFDLSTFEARINYMNNAGIGDMYIVDDLAVDGDDPSLMTFTWLVGRNACAYKGNTQFIVCLKKFDDNDNVIQEFNTTVYSLPVLQGLETTEAIQQQNPDIIEHILTLIEDMGGVDLSNYYTKAQVNALKLPNPNKLTINGVDYDGSAAVEMEIEGGSSQTTEIADGQIIHVTDAVANEAIKELTLYDSNSGVINSANIAVANKNLFRLDLLAQQTVSKGVTFIKNADGAIHATGTSTGTYAAAQAAIDKNAFVVGETYTISSGKTSGKLYVQLILNYTDGTTDYLVASNQPYTFTLQKEVSSVIGSVQITASGVTVDEWIYPMIELSDMASAFVMNSYASMTFNGSTMPALPDSISNVWSNDDTVANIVMEYWNDPVMAKINELEKQFNQTVEHDEELNATSERAVQNKTVTAELFKKIDKPTTGSNGQVLTKTADGIVWSNAGAPTDAQAAEAVADWLDEHPEATTTVQDGSISVDKLANDTLALIGNGAISEDVKQALMNLVEHVAFIGDDPTGRTYIDALEDALYPPANLAYITASFNQSGAIIYNTDTLNDLKQYLTVTAYYDDGTNAFVNNYSLSGTLTVGTSTITVTYEGKTATFDVTVLSDGTIYSLNNHVFDGTVSSVVDTELSLLASDTSFTILVDITTNTAQLSDPLWRILSCMNSSPTAGINIGAGSGTNVLTTRWMQKYSTRNTTFASFIGNTKVVMTHEAGTRSATTYVKIGTNEVKTYTDTDTKDFVPTNEHLYIGGTPTGTRVLKGTASVKIYDSVLPSERINSFLGVE